MQLHYGRFEHPLVDVHPTRKVLLFPLIEFLVFTGLIWLIIGLIDKFIANTTPYIPTGGIAQFFSFFWNFVNNTLPSVLGWVRIGLIIFWVLGLLFILIRPVVKRRRTRIIITNERIVVHGPKNQSVQYPLRDIERIEKRRGSILVWFYGVDKALTLDNPPYKGKIQKILESQSAESMEKFDRLYSPDPDDDLY